MNKIYNYGKLTSITLLLSISSSIHCAPSSGGGVKRDPNMEFYTVQGQRFIKAWPHDTYWLEQYFNDSINPFDRQLNNVSLLLNKINYCQVLENTYQGLVDHSVCSKFTTSTSSDPTKWIQPATWSFPSEQNGCGSGAWAEAAAVRLSKVYGFTGNKDEPVLGSSFLKACNQHDQCYSNQNSKQICDINFLENLRNVCINTSNGMCDIATGVYSGLVTEFGNSAYKDAGVVRACKALKKAVDKNCQ